MKYTLSIDPGWTWGAVLGQYDDDTPWERIDYWQRDGGVDSFIEWFQEIYWYERTGDSAFAFDTDSPGRYFYVQDTPAILTVIAEQFVLLPSPGRTPKTRDLEPLPVEGALKAMYSGTVWQRASCQNLAGGDDPKERRKNTDKVLKDYGLWLTGKNVGMKDANDVLSATRHALYYMMFTLKHEPTMSKAGLEES